MKKCIYTVITGKYDYPLPYLSKLDDWDYICFTDQPIKSDFWEIRPIPEELRSLSLSRLNRAIKIRPHLYLGDYNYSIYIDANCELILPPIVHNDFFTVNAHERRKCLYTEAKLCKKLGLDSPSIIDKLVLFYKSLGMPPNWGLYHCHYLGRWHNHPTCKAIMNDWWELVEKFSFRDQISLPYVLWKYSYHPNYQGVEVVTNKHLCYDRERKIVSVPKYNAEINPRIALCCIERLENQYIREFVNYYRSLGFGHIFMYDTNSSELDDVTEVIGDYIANGYVTLIKWGSLPSLEVKEAYNDCYHNRLLEYDWCLFVDPDEYLELYKEDNITDYINRLSSFDCIQINWKTMDDNDLIYNDGRALRLRFNRVSGVKDDVYFKSLVRTGLPNIDFLYKGSAHGPHKTPLRRCDNRGLEVPFTGQAFLTYINWDDAAIVHYRCKTMEEYIRNKQEKLKGYVQINFNMHFFFLYNIPTYLKINLYKLIENGQSFEQGASSNLN